MKNEKKAYTAPGVEVIQLDNEISLELNSNPATGPGETYHSTSPVSDPFKGNMA